MMNQIPCVLVGLSASLAFGAADDWPHFRGPAGDGSASSSVFEGRAFELETAWSVPIGSGYSGIVVSEDTAVTMCAAGEVDIVLALDATTGAERWRFPLGPAYHGHDGSDDGPVSTPLITGQTVVALSPRGVLFALDVAAGALRWQRDLVGEFDSTPPEYGYATTPVAHDDLVFVQIGGSDGRALGAFELETGELRWSAGDEAVSSQSPLITTLAGVRQLIAYGEAHLTAYEPATGSELWQIELDRGDRTGSGIAIPVDDRHFAAVARGGLVEYEVERSADGAISVVPSVRSRDLGGSYAPPVRHGDYYYGFRSDFLTCVDARTGRRVWKSRPPGGKGLLLVRDKLVVFGAHGRAVVVAATPDEYREEASIEVFDGSAFTWPSFADDRIYLRNPSAMAAIRVVDAPQGGAVAAAAEAPAPQSAFAAFVTALEQAPDKDERVAQFLDQHDTLPVIEDDLVHFVYVGDVSDVAIAASMLDSSRPVPLQRVVGTDLFHATFRVEPGSRVQYTYQLDLGRWAPDPRNPDAAPGEYPQQTVSCVFMPGYERPTHIDAPTGPTGRFETITWTSAALDVEREVTVYVPAAFDAEPQRRFDLLVMLDGKSWREATDISNTLDNLCGNSVAPIVVAFVDPIDEWWLEGGGSEVEQFVDATADELVPLLEERFRLRAAPESRAMHGASHFALTAAYAAFHRPDAFGKAAVRSVALQYGAQDRLMDLIAARKAAVRLYVDWTLYEPFSVDQNFDGRADARRLAEALDAAGYSYAGGAARDSSGWYGWSARSDRMLEALFPITER